MRWRAPAAAAVLALAAVVLTRGAGPEIGTPATSPRLDPAGADQPVPSSELKRNPFEYAGPPAAAAQERARPAPALGAVAPSTFPDAVRVVGFLRRGGELRAVLSVDGDVLLAATGEIVAGYRVLALDEESGVRLLAPDGSERRLSVP